MLTYKDDAWYVLHLFGLFQVSFLACVIEAFLTVYLVMAQLMFFFTLYTIYCDVLIRRV
jgi:hypothetical protein